MEDDQASEESGTGEYDEVVITKNTETVDAFSSCVIPMKAEKAYMGEGINILTQALPVEDGSLPQGLTVQNAYTELRKGSKNAVMVVRNSIAYSQTLKKKTLVHNHLQEILDVGAIQPRVHGVTWLCWSERRTEAYASVLTSAILASIQRRTPTPC